MNLSAIKQIIEEERQLYIPENYFFMKSIHHKRYLIWKTLASFRLAQYWKNELSNNTICFFRRCYAKSAYRYYCRKRNVFGEKSGVEIANHSTLGRHLDIWHGGVVISGHLGDNCVIHGNNVIGNKGNGERGIPVLGDHVDIGVGAVIIGDIDIAAHCRIGANAVVARSFTEPGCLIVGVPAYVKGK